MKTTSLTQGRVEVVGMQLHGYFCDFGIKGKMDSMAAVLSLVTKLKMEHIDHFLG